LKTPFCDRSTFTKQLSGSTSPQPQLSSHDRAMNFSHGCHDQRQLTPTDHTVAMWLHPKM
jgi:hypothetical protein